MDAQVAYGFHHIRNEKPYLAQGPVSNKLIYSGFSCTQGWFFTPCSNDPRLSHRNTTKHLLLSSSHKAINNSSTSAVATTPLQEYIKSMNNVVKVQLAKEQIMADAVMMVPSTSSSSNLDNQMQQFDLHKEIDFMHMLSSYGYF